MSKQKGKKDFKKQNVKEEKFIDEENDKKSIILILIAIVAVLGLIIASIFIYDKKDDEDIDDKGGQKIEIKVPSVVESEEDESKVAVVKKYVVKYLDADGNQIGKTQKVLDLEDRVNERPPKIDGKRFREWRVEYDTSKKIYYYIATYIDNVERVPKEEEQYLKNEDTYKTTITKVDPNEVATLIGEIEEEMITNPTYYVEVNGEVEENNLTDINATISENNPGEELTIEEEYAHIIALRFNAPEGVTKEDIEKMLVSIYKEDGETALEEGKYHYNGEELNEEGNKKTGRDLLDSTDEEYENNIFYFNYYQEVDTKENTVVEVYWGNDAEADSEAMPTSIPPRDEYVEVYTIDVQNVTTEEVEEI